jgi:predicted component of type VI protein secretion system
MLDEIEEPIADYEPRIGKVEVFFLLGVLALIFVPLFL